MARVTARTWLRVAAGLLLAVLGVAALLYFFGTPSSGGGPAASAAATSVASKVPAPDPGSPLAVQIPGCVCHSKDPALVRQHSAYRMNQCAGCHTEGVPTGR